MSSGAPLSLGWRYDPRERVVSLVDEEAKDGSSPDGGDDRDDDDRGVQRGGRRRREGDRQVQVAAQAVGPRAADTHRVRSGRVDGGPPRRAGVGGAHEVQAEADAERGEGGEEEIGVRGG